MLLLSQPPQAFAFKKVLPEGVADRLSIIAKHDSNYLQVIMDTTKATKRNSVKMEDVIDATILAISAKATDIKTAPVDRKIGDRDAILF